MALMPPAGSPTRSSPTSSKSTTRPTSSPSSAPRIRSTSSSGSSSRHLARGASSPPTTLSPSPPFPPFPRVLASLTSLQPVLRPGRVVPILREREDPERDRAVPERDPPRPWRAREGPFRAAVPRRGQGECRGPLLRHVRRLSPSPSTTPLVLVLFCSRCTGAQADRDGESEQVERGRDH